MGETCKAKVADLDDAVRRNENVCGLQVSVDDVCVMQVQKAVEQLISQ